VKFNVKKYVNCLKNQLTSIFCKPLHFYTFRCTEQDTDPRCPQNTQTHTLQVICKIDLLFVMFFSRYFTILVLFVLLITDTGYFVLLITDTGYFVLLITDTGYFILKRSWIVTFFQLVSKS